MKSYNLHVTDPDGTPHDFVNVAFHDDQSMLNWVSQLPATLVSYVVTHDDTVVAPSVQMFKIRYRDTRGQLFEMTIPIPGTLPSGDHIAAVRDIADILAHQFDMIFLTSEPIDPKSTNISNNPVLTGPPIQLFNMQYTDPAIVNTGVPQTAVQAGVQVATVIDSALNNVQTKPIHRFILQTPDLSFSTGFRYDTGADYPQCSISNTAACQPMQFGSVQDAINYALAHNEIPVSVQSSAEVWNIIAGNQPVPPALTGGVSNMSLGLIGLGLLFVHKLFGRSAA